MKTSVLVLLTLLPMVAAAAADQPSLTFPHQKIGLPPLSLAELGKLSPMGFLKEAGIGFGRRTPFAAAGKKVVSHMPIGSARDTIDPKMTVHPGSSTDYKLTVKTPNVEPAK